jgi:hypothetical protein
MDHDHYQARSTLKITSLPERRRKYTTSKDRDAILNATMSNLSTRNDMAKWQLNLGSLEKSLPDSVPAMTGKPLSPTKFLIPANPSKHGQTVD